jgi:hypothetical protein
MGGGVVLRGCHEWWLPRRFGPLAKFPLQIPCSADFFLCSGGKIPLLGPVGNLWRNALNLLFFMARQPAVFPRQSVDFPYFFRWSRGNVAAALTNGTSFRGGRHPTKPHGHSELRDGRINAARFKIPGLEA